ncbi:MAG TPA: hypothetical protein VLM75_08530 [Spirochaetota bacterium]|nr:hypothetical protein [Spirochaetota bacterium]
MRHRAFAIAVSTLLALSMVGSLHAQPEEAAPPESAFRHDGLFLRFQTGFGFGRTLEKDVGGRDITMSGNAGAFRFQLGGAVFENLIIYGELGAISLTDPSIKGERGYIATTPQSDVTLTMSDTGLGACWYFMPVNMYISGSVTLSRDRLEIDKAEGSTDHGAGVYVSAGKEWWVSDNWGLGVAIFAYASRMQTRDSAPFSGRYTVYNTVAGIVFSATYN